MKLRTKIFLIFLTALIFTILLVFFGLTFVLDSLSSKMMKKQAAGTTQFLQHIVIGAMSDPDEETVLNSIAESFIIAKHVADSGKSFELKKILLISPDYRVKLGFPDSETGTDYSSHEDIKDAFIRKSTETVTEKYASPDGVISNDIDVVTYFESLNGKPYVLEVKLDFAKSFALLEAQYTAIETGGIVISIFLIAMLLGVLLVMISRTAVRPVIKVTRAMESVGSGDLDIELPEKSLDEFGLLARRFNEMVSGLKEKFQLYSYVSKDTIAAVRDSVIHGTVHKAERKIKILFFSDIRGFTTYSESRDTETVITTLNKILSAQARIIKKFGGDIDKFVGDEIMAVFDDASSAIDAALLIHKEMNSSGESFDSLHLGVGIHLGEVMQGDVGSDDIRDFTVIGDTVNTAARLESIAGKDETYISENVFNSGRVRFEYVFVKKGKLRLKGKETEIMTYLVKEKKTALV